jgi:glycosyltransferase involved in cell wall biosynthesis
MAKIFISIASYRDPELVPTIKDCLANAKNPKNLIFSIAWQHSADDVWDNLDEFKDDPRFKIIDINYADSKGACWARNAIQQNYSNEDYYFQLDSHHRFIKNWDVECIKMIKQLKKAGHEKPLLTSYISSYNPENDPAERVQEPWWLTFDRFIPEGAIFFLPATIPGWQEMTKPIPSRFLSAHFIFTIGKWCQEVPYDPELYFHGEEISLAVRSYTWGYDLFHPHKVIAWHEYTRKGRTKQWDDDKEWVEKNNHAHRRNRILFGIEPGCTGCMRNQLGTYNFGTIRTLEQYENYSGIKFKTRGIQQYTLDNKFAPNPIYDSLEEYEASFAQVFKHCIDVGYQQVPETDYDFWCVAFENEQGETIFREDAQLDEITRMKNDPDGYCKVWRTFKYAGVPTKWIVWPHSISKGWCNKIEGILPT